MIETIMSLREGNIIYLSIKYDGELKFHFVDEYEDHIDGYWLFKIDCDYGLDRYIEVGTNVKKSDIDTDINDDYGKLKITGVDEL